MKIFLPLFLLSCQAWAFSPVQEEVLYRRYYREFFEAPAFSKAPASVAEQKLALDAIEDALQKGAATLKLVSWFTPGQLAQLAAVERIRLIRLKAERKVASAGEEASLPDLAEENGPRARYELRRLLPLVKSAEVKAALLGMGIAPLGRKSFRAPGVEEVKSLYNELPDLAGFMKGRYAGTPRIFVFCRHDHNYPCLLSMRDKNNEVVKENGKTWLQPALGLSALGLPYNERNGNTPQGAQLVDGVMPVADLPFYYGKFRRLILTFAPASKGEAEQKKLFPPLVRKSAWWREAVEARDMGRNLLRIHGVGEINKEPTKAYYPFIPTIGCLAQREGKYGKSDFTDQRKLLDHFMSAAGLEPKFENEPRIRGVMYTIEIDDKASPVTPADLRQYGIF